MIWVLIGVFVAILLFVLLAGTWSAIELGISEAVREYESKLEQKAEEIEKLKAKARGAGRS